MKWALRAVLVFSATGLCLAKASMSDAQAAKRMEDAQQYAARGALRQAAHTLESILRARPDDNAALAMLCEVTTADADALEMEPVAYELVRKRFLIAAEACKKAASVEREPSVSARRAWAHDVVHAEDAPELVPAFEAWAAAEPKSARAVGGLAAWLKVAGRGEEANALVERAVVASPAFGQRVRFEYVCRASGFPGGDDLQPFVDMMLADEATVGGRAMIDVLQARISQGRNGILEFLELVDRGTISEADADHLFSCLTAESFFSWLRKSSKPGPGETLPVKQTWQAPRYPDDERYARRQGKVFIVARINVDGTVGPVWVARTTTPSFAASAVEAVKHATYRPATRDNESVPFPVLLRVDFKFRR